MSAASACRRAPLVNPVFAPFADQAIHPEGPFGNMFRQTLDFVDVSRMSSLDSVLATRLGGYNEMPPMPDVEAAQKYLPSDPGLFLDTMESATHIAIAARDKEGMLRVLAAMRVFFDTLPMLEEDVLFWCGAQALRLTITLYQRTGQRFLLAILETLRSRLPDVSGLMHSFPFQREYRREAEGNTPDEKKYYDRMERFATGKGTADAMAMSALLGRYSGSGRDAAAAEVGLNAVYRFHGMPGGAFSADPHLAGKAPSNAVELEALCAQVEAYCDALSITGKAVFADKLERILLNALPDLISETGLRSLQPTNRLKGDESCEYHKPEAFEASMLLRAMYALRRSVWMSREDDTVAYLLPVDCGCLTRVAGVPVRFTATVNGFAKKEVRIRVETKEPVQFKLQLLIPRWADGASLSVNGARGMAVVQGEYHTLNRTFQTGDEVVLTLTAAPRLETGFRGSASVLVGNHLMALSLPEDDMAWQYALNPSIPMTASEENGEACVLVAASVAESWQAKDGFILPPPQNVTAGPAYQLTLLPYADCDGRIAAFPCVRE